MVNVRFMSDEPGRARAVADAVAAALRGAPGLIIGDISVRPNRRGPGERAYVEILTTDTDHDRVVIDAEVVPDQPPTHRPVGRRTRALPPGR